MYYFVVVFLAFHYSLLLSYNKPLLYSVFGLTDVCVWGGGVGGEGSYLSGQAVGPLGFESSCFLVCDRLRWHWYLKKKRRKKLLFCFSDIFKNTVIIFNYKSKGSVI